jgi:hypothetical protein
MNQRSKSAGAASAPIRVQGVSTQQTVFGGVCRLVGLLVANANAAVQTLTIKDGSTTLVVLSIPANDSRQFDLALPFATALNATPSHANIDALFLVVS